MSLVVWCTDIHLNFVMPNGPSRFGTQIKEEYPNVDSIVVSGDIGEHHNFATLIEQFAVAAGVPVYFVLGNHDAYNGSIKGMRDKAAAMNGKARWLVKEKLVELAPGVALVGHDGWYDARFGEPKRSRVMMSDFIAIRELLGLTRDETIDAVRKIADGFADEARELLEDAIGKGYKRILFATHVPPYAQATWHQGKTSDDNWLPWMSNRAMGEMLDDVSGTHPDVEFTVLCGHTHSAGRYERGPNLTVLTGHSEYYDPRVCGSFSF